MKKIKSNYDIICENQKKQIVFNIFPDIISEEFISYPKDNINNNDTLNFVSKIFEFLESNIYSFCQCFLNSMKSFNRTFYKIQYILLIMTLLFTFVYSFEDNSNISTNLIVSAYFPNSSHLTHIMYENVQKSSNFGNSYGFSNDYIITERRTHQEDHSCFTFRKMQRFSFFNIFEIAAYCSDFDLHEGRQQ